MAGYSAAQEIAEHYKDSPTTSNGWYRIPCPAHHGVGNNLALKDGDYGGLLVTCHSVGCSRKDIFQAFKDAGLAVKQEWTYPNGKHVKRIDTAEGKMVYGEGSTKGVPILIGEDSPGNLVVITEGEDDYNAIISADLRAVTAACYVGGSNAAKSADYSALKGRAVAVWPDHDKQGLAGAASAALACLEAGASSVDIIPPTGQPDSGSGAADLTLEAIPVWICNRRPWTPAPGRQHFTPTPLSDILQLPPTNWVVEGLIAEDSTNILIGRPKTGKTVWMLSLLKAMSTGGQFLGFDVPQGHSWLFTEQNRQSFQSQLRMTKIQGDDLITPYLRLNIEPGLTPDQFADHLYSDFMAATVKPTLIVIDTIGAFILIDDFNDYGKVRVAMNPLILMAQRVGQYCGTRLLYSSTMPGRARAMGPRRFWRPPYSQVSLTTSCVCPMPRVRAGGSYG